MLTLYFFAPIVLYVYGISGIFVGVFKAQLLLGIYFPCICIKDKVGIRQIGASGGVSGILFAAVAYAPNEIKLK